MNHQPTEAGAWVIVARPDFYLETNPNTVNDHPQNAPVGMDEPYNTQHATETDAGFCPSTMLPPQRLIH